ncbi:zinc finger protein 708-like [Salmo salar]|uniref:Zinc finger protein 708-like n=1 Tax=Salmo salar TaxID=8030 RepID=A0ABM3EME1_SALSA|nr:zinc finger protein 708-like [Salmo salar]
MSKLQLLNVFITERLISAAVDIFGSSEKTLAEYQERLTTAAFEIFVVVEKTIAEFQGENDRLRDLLLGHFGAEPQQLTLPEEEVSPKQQQQHCEQEWNPSPGQEDPEPTQITEEQEELRTSQEEEQLQRLRSATTEVVQLIFIPPCVESDCDQDCKTDSLPGNTSEQTQSALDDEDYRVSQLTSHFHPLSAVNPHCSSALSEIIVSIDEDESEELPSGSKKKQSSQVCTKAKTTSELKASLKSHTSRRPYKCYFCHKSFISLISLKLHHKGAKERQQKFLACCKSFHSTASLKYHQIIHTGKKSLKCQKGGRSVRCKYYFNKHMRTTHPGAKTYSCPVCSKGFRKPCSLKEHQMLHGEKPNQSSVSSTDFNTLPNYKVHQSTRTGEKSFNCPVCIKSFASASLLKIHQIYHTGEKSHKCKECDKCFYHKGHLVRHMMTHTGEKLYKCSVCEKSFISFSALKKHGEIEDDPCHHEVCGKSVMWKGSLTEHLSMHTGEKSSKRLVYEKGLTSSSVLKRHQLDRCGGKPEENQSEKESYLCSDCGKSFRTISYLRVHMKTHRERELHKCPVCGKCFTSSAYFKLHQRIHTGEKQHQCFTLSGHLTEHMRTHTGEKSFKCPVCGKSFTSSSVLKRHQQNHCGKTAKEKQSEETSYLCSDCGKSFRTMSYLRVHMKTHRERELHKCPVCGKGFRWASSLKNPSENSHRRETFSVHGL